MTKGEGTAGGIDSMTKQALPLPTAVPGHNTSSEVREMDWGCYVQAGGWATRHEVDVEAIKPKALVE